MIRFSRSGVALVHIDKWTPLKEFDRLITMFENNDTSFHKVEFIIDVGRLVDVEQEYFWNGFMKYKQFLFTDVRWHHLRQVAMNPLAKVIIKQGSWYFSISEIYDTTEHDGHGVWYSGEMLNVGWFHGGEEIDHSHNYARRDYGS